MALPDRLLNRTNKELKAKVDRLEDQLKTNLATIQLEKHVLDSTGLQVKDAKTKLMAAKKLEEGTKQRLAKEQEEAAKAKADASKARQVLSGLAARKADTTVKVHETEARLLQIRKNLERKQIESKEVDAQLMQWFEENKLTQNATSAASSVFQDQSDQVSKARRQSELLTTQMNDLQQQIRVEEESTAKFAHDEQDCHDAIRTYKNEIDKTQRDLSELSRQQEAHDEHAEEIKNAKLRHLAELKAKQQERNEIAQVARAEAASADSVERSKERAIGIWNRMRRDLSTLSEKVNHEQLLERGEHQMLLIALQEQGRLKKDHEALEEKRHRLKEAIDVAEQQISQLEAQTGLKVDQGTDDLKGELDAIFALQEEQKTNLDRANKMMERGRDTIQRLTTDQVETAKMTEVVSKEVVWRRQQLGKSKAQEAELAKKLVKYDEVIQSIDQETAFVQDRISEEAAKHEGHSTEAKQRMTAHVIQLRDELQQAERQHQQLLRATTAVNSSVTVTTREFEGALKEIDQLENMIRENEAEIKVLTLENQRRAEDRAKSAGQVEELVWRVEALSTAAKAANVDTVEARRQTEELHQQLVATSKDNTVKNDRLGELRVEENAKRNLVTRLQGLEDRSQLLESRYVDYLQAMRAKVTPHGPEHQEARTILATELETPEDIEARAMVLRSQQRGELLERGNSLDSKIVQAEIDCKTVSNALQIVQDQPADGAGLMQLEPETLLFLEEVKNKFQLEADVVQQKELSYWTEEQANATEQLASLRQRMEHIRGSFETAKDERQSQLTELRRLQREKAELDRLVSGEQMHMTKVQNVVKVKQSQVFSNPSVGTYVQHQERESQYKTCLAKLTRLIAKASSNSGDGAPTAGGGSATRGEPAIYFTFRELIGRYGLEGEFGATEQGSTATSKSVNHTTTSHSTSGVHRGSISSNSTGSTQKQPSGAQTGGGAFTSMLSVDASGITTSANTTSTLSASNRSSSTAQSSGLLGTRGKGQQSPSFNGRSASRALVQAIADRGSSTLGTTRSGSRGGGRIQAPASSSAAAAAAAAAGTRQASLRDVSNTQSGYTRPTTRGKAQPVSLLAVGRPPSSSRRM